MFFLENNIERDVHLKNQYRIKNLPDPISIKDACSKNYVDILFKDLSIMKNSKDIELNDKSITNVKFMEVNHLPEIGYQLPPKLYVDNVIRNSLNESPLLRLDLHEKLKIDEQDSKLLKSTLTSRRPEENYLPNLMWIMNLIILL